MEPRVALTHSMATGAAPREAQLAAIREARAGGGAGADAARLARRAQELAGAFRERCAAQQAAVARLYAQLAGASLLGRKAAALRLAAARAAYLRRANAALASARGAQAGALGQIAAARERLAEARARLGAATRALRQRAAPPAARLYSARVRAVPEPEDGLTPDQLFMRRRLSARESFRSRCNPVSLPEPARPGHDVAALQRSRRDPGEGAPASAAQSAVASAAASRAASPAPAERAVVRHEARVE